MRNYYYPKEAVLTAAISLGAWASVQAQAPLSVNTMTAPAKTVVAPSAAYPDFEECPSGRLTREYAEQNGIQHLYALGQWERQNTAAEEDPNRAVRTIPVVFHVVYNTASENVSDAVIHELLERLNEDFRKNNSSIPSIRPAFAGLATDAQIEFCLATKDPQGNTLATPGITRTQTNMTYFNPSSSSVSGTVGGQNSMKTATYGKAPWDRTKYVNIWICDITNGAQSGTAGYAYLPACTTSSGCLPNAAIDGIVLDYNIGVQNGNSRAVSHEMGHFLGLDHTWGDANGTCGTGDDGFSDTPPVKGPYANYYFTCSSSTTHQSCTSGVLWMHENMMDYSNCYCMFTTMQANYMNGMLSGARNSLVNSTATNCAAATPTVPVANFTGCNANVNQGSTVTFTDASTGIPTSWSWSITPATGWSFVNSTSASSQNPQVQFTAVGNYTISLTATNAAGSNTKTTNNCITVVAVTCNTLSSPLTMGFESSESTTGWVVENTNNDQTTGGNAITWGIVSNATLASNNIQASAHGGTQTAYYLYNSVQAANDWLFTPCLSLTAGTTYSLKFWYRAMQNYPERMRVRIGTAANSASMNQTIVDLNNITNTSWIQSTPNTFTVPATGNYYIGFQAYSAADRYILFLDDINISIQGPAVVAPVANFNGCGTYLAGNTVSFTNTSTNSPTSNAWAISPSTGWSFVNGTGASSANPQVVFNTPGTYTVSLTAGNAGGSDTKTAQSCVIVNQNNVGLEDPDFASGISLYPNPSSGLTTVRIDNAAQYNDIRVNVYNAVGELVYNVKQTTDEMTLDLSTFSKGIYFIEIRSNEAVSTKRLVLSR